MNESAGVLRGELAAYWRRRTGAVQKAQVLIVDDEADVIQALKLRLETAGYRAVTASDGAEALDMLRRNDIDLILADLMMPNLDGLELTRRIRQDPGWLGVEVLLFSSHDDPVSHGLALELGALDYLSKAIGARAIVSRIQEVLATSRTVDSEPPTEGRGYKRAELDLCAQLRALSDASGPTAHPLGTALESTPMPRQGAAQQDPNGELIQLAKALEGWPKVAR